MSIERPYYFFIDVETGGLSLDCSLLTFDGTLLDADLNPVASIALKMKPDDGLYRIQAEAMKVNKIDLLSHDKGAIPISEARRQLQAWIDHWIPLGAKNPEERVVTVGQNVWYDIEFIQSTLYPEWKKVFSRRVIDLQAISLLWKAAKIMPPKQRISLSEMVKYHNIDIDVEKMHASDVDVQASIEIFKKYARMLECMNAAKGTINEV